LPINVTSLRAKKYAAYFPGKISSFGTIIDGGGVANGAALWVTTGGGISGGLYRLPFASSHMMAAIIMRI
jgi:hypothetical protein